MSRVHMFNHLLVQKYFYDKYQFQVIDNKATLVDSIIQICILHQLQT